MAAPAATARPSESAGVPPAQLRAQLGRLGVVQQIVLPRGDGRRALRLYLAYPQGAAPAQGWPVLYMLDGNAAFQALAAAGRGDLARRAVLVGIGYDVEARLDGDARAWDYTPRLPGAGDDGTPDPRAAQRRNGGADALLDLIELRIKPLVRAAAPVDDTRQTLYGHSYGGLFVLHALRARPGAFQRYVAASPSLWWHAPFMAQSMLSLDAAPCCGKHPAELHLMAGAAESLRSPGAAPRATAGDLRSLAAVLAGRPGLRVDYREFPGLGHGAMLPASAIAAAEIAGRP
ncbi:alpha/beta hydrolase [Pollutimonas bauzanensis]|nr:alpha/beta hydrolase-fold protein [Pollutimonas bauzanensis]